MPGIGAILFGLSAISLAATPDGTPTCTPPRPFGSSLTVVPPGPISSQIDFEVRVSVRNQTLKDATFELILGIVGSDGTRATLCTRSLEVKQNDQQLITKRIPAAQYVGKNRVQYRLLGPNGFKVEGHWPLEVVRCETRALPFLQVGWMDPGAVSPGVYEQRRPVTEADLRAKVDACYALGMTGLIITYPESVYQGRGYYYPTRVFADHGSPVSFDVVGTILSQASRNGQKVFVGLGRGADLWLTWNGFNNSKRIDAALAHSMKTATELWSLYGHESSFYGWYLTHEANDIAQASRAYYNPMVDFLRTFEADKPVMVSPAGTPMISTEILKASKVDIFAYQDAVGSGYVSNRNTFDPQRRIDMLKQVYASYASAHRGAGKHLWSNLEIWQMDGPDYGNSYPPKFERVKAQLDIEKHYVDVITAYEVVGFFESSSSKVGLGGQRAIDLFEAYGQYYTAMIEHLMLVEE